LRNKLSSTFLSITSVLIAIISIQSGASLAKQLFPIVGATGATALRLSIAAVILLIIWRPWKTKLTRRQLITIAIYGTALGCMNLFFYLALARIPLGVAVALEFTGPLAIAIFSSHRLMDFIWAVLAVIGIILIIPHSQKIPLSHYLGIVYALGAGACWAMYILFGQKAGATVHGGQATSLGMLAGALVIFPIGLSQHASQLFQLKVIPLAVVVAILSSALPYSLEMLALKKIPIKTFSIWMSIEPAMAAVAGLIFLGEHLSGKQWLAILCIIIASIGSALFIRKKTATPSPIDTPV